MANGENVAYCGNCGNPVQAGDTFCGVCGSRIPPDAQDASPTREIPTLVPPPPSIPGRRRNRKLITGVMVGTLLVLMLLGGGALALTGLGSGGGLLGATGGDPGPSGGSDGSGGRPEGRQPTTPSSAPSEPSWMSDEEIAALEGFGRDYDGAVRRGNWDETYSMLDEESQQEFTEKEWTERQQILADTTEPSAPLEDVSVEQEEQVADGPVTVRLVYEDGTDETMTAYTPQVVEDPGDSGVPKRLLTEEEISELEELPSFPTEPTTSTSPEATTPGSNTLGAEEAQAGAREAAEAYYEAAGLEDWGYTYEHLDAETQSHFTRDEWIQKNEWFADNGEVIYRVESVDQVGTSTEYLAVTLTLTYEDGSSSARTTYFVYEDGEWKHRFGQEEDDLFMPELSYEEFVAAQ